MEGVILFADDHIFDSQRLENKLFNKFNNDGSFSILPINNLTILEKTVSSISTYKALILDWNFQRESNEEGVEIPDENPFEFLKGNRLYSLIYIYSQAAIEEAKRTELQALYPGKIFFETKDPRNEVDTEFNKIIEGIKAFEESNKHLSVPFIWSKSINQSAQSIFSDLEVADKYWIKELYYSSVRKFDKDSGEAKEVEIEPTIEVINLFQNLLTERLIQKTELIDSIKKYAIENYQQTPEAASITNLYSRLYYTNTFETDPVMTGDIFQIDANIFGVIISPECDMMKLVKKDEMVDLLCFAPNDFKKIDDFCKNEDEIKRAYNQEIAALHLLPIFPFTDTIKATGLIDFRFSMKQVKGKFLESIKANRRIKINTPYIQQLRQRYLSYIGRVGVPAIPNSLRAIK